MFKRVFLVAALAATLLTTASVRAQAAPASATWPGIKLIAAEDTVEVVRYGDEPVPLDLGILAVAGNRPFEVWLKRQSYRSPVQATQHDRSGRRSRFLAEVTAASVQNGIKDFFIGTITRADGRRVLRSDVAFCPDGWDRIRLAPWAAETNRYPAGCIDFPYATGSVLGLEAGWGSPVRTFPWVNLADGEYHVTLSIRYQYRQMFSISEQDANVGVDINVVTVPCCDELPPPWEIQDRARRAAVRAAAPAVQRPVRPSGKAAAAPPADTRPDLVAIPPWDVQMESGERDILRFAGTVWNAGPAPLVVDGFRNKGDVLMAAYQNFYRGKTRVGWSKIGELEWDPRPGHEHWHFRDFAQYRLLDADGAEVMPAEKEAFCLAPTNAVDMTVKNADWGLYTSGDLPGTQCGGKSSLALREVMQTGFADTYGAGTPGQEFDVTDLPNGSYMIEVHANAARRLVERSTANNVALRQIEIGGRPGARTVQVRPYQGITA